MKTLPIPKKKELERDYERLGSQTKLAEKYKVSGTTIGNWFKKLGIKSFEQRCRE